MKNFSIERKISIKEKIFRKIFLKLEKKYIKKFEKDNFRVWEKLNIKKEYKNYFKFANFLK